MRGKKIEGVVEVAFVVTADGKVENARVEGSSHPAFETPALNAVRKWKFEPGVRAGQRVPRKVRITIRFPSSGAS
jgi:protein TonB